MTISNEYLAGFLDGEGYFGLMRRRGKTPYGERHGYQPAVKTAQKEQDSALLYELKKQYGGYIQIKKPNKTSQSAIVWEIKDKSNLLVFLPEIIPYMIVKKRQAELLLEYCELGFIHPRLKNQKVVHRAKEIFDELKSLKYKSLATTE